MSKLKVSKWICILFVFCAATAIGTSAQTFTTLHSFDKKDGAYPYGALVQGTNGDLYGTTIEGGAHKHGTFFKITLSGALTTLYSFCRQVSCADGAEPFAGLIQGTDGNFYGTTYEGGANTNCLDGCGTVFRTTAGGRLTTLHLFDDTDGYEPYAGLVQRTDGKFYGTTVGGGANGEGTVFRITPGGKLTSLHSFGFTDGYQPYAGLVQGSNGKFYGTTSGGGASGDGGTVFSITAGGTLTTLHSFDGTDGDYLLAGLVKGTDGNFYGTTSTGGASGQCGSRGCGTFFKITPSGALTTLHSFNYTDGAYPRAALVQGADGNFYGTTYGGGANGDYGTVFSITARGKLTTLYNFCSLSGCTDGATPYAGLVQDTNGMFYGTTTAGGANSSCGGYPCGTVFSLSVGLEPFVETRPTAGKIRTAVKILGSNLTGATSVTFNGTAATFTVKSKSEITTTVPSGATTGTVQVVTLGGTLSSNVPFRVTD